MSPSVQVFGSNEDSSDVDKRKGAFDNSYLDITPGVLIVGIVQAITSVANGILQHILGSMGASLRGNARNIHRLPQVDNEILVKVRALGTPCVHT